ncbi:ethylene-responsive transcription factor 3-like [Cornus florida]|uniref:ethylene-responsive transcription factor 3-like n=1 Tax=Cornus florida TaxID=4283 RepID=UPI00289A20F6|nr:ethylene-responsive transcription factor 3-like [Cornus florida]
MTKVAAAAEGATIGPPRNPDEEPKYRGMQKQLWGNSSSRSETPGRRSESGCTFNFKDAAARVYAAAARSLRGPEAKTNFPLLPFSIPNTPNTNPNNGNHLQDDDGFHQFHLRPTTNSLSSTLESSSGPRSSNPPQKFRIRRWQKPQPVGVRRL